MPKINHRLVSVFLFLKKSQISAFFIPFILPKTNGGLILCGVYGNNAFGDCTGPTSCALFTGGTMGGNTENCALLTNSSGTALVSDVGEVCYGNNTSTPVLKIEECTNCKWGYEKQDSGQIISTKCGLFNVQACVKKQMTEVQCDFNNMYVESFSNQNGCADGELEYFPTHLAYGYLGPVEHCWTCQSGYKKKTISVDVEGCSNGPFEVDICTQECSRASDCPGYVTAQGTPVTGKPGLLKQIQCKDINEDGAKECTWKYICNFNEGYYNGMITTNYGPTSCNKCPLYQGKYGEDFIRRNSSDETINGCYIPGSSTISATEGTIEFESHCYY